MSADLFFEQYVLSFLKLWRNIFGIVFLFFFILFFISSLFLQGQLNNLSSEVSLSKVKVNEKEFTDMRAKALEFNTMVDAIRREPREGIFFSNFIDYFIALTSENKITIDRLELSSPASSIQVSGRAPDSNTVVIFKNVLLKNERFMNVDLPLFGIRDLSNNTVSFSLAFSVNPVLFQ